MKELKIDVMGCPYKVLVGKADEIHIDKENMGECRTRGKKILVKTDKEDCKKRELEVRTQEILAHEIFHAYLNECGLELDSQVEEQLANFYMKNWRKMNNSVLECLDELGLTFRKSYAIITIVQDMREQDRVSTTSITRWREL